MYTPLVIGIRELRSELARHVRRAAAGERVVIAVGGRPAAALVPLTEVSTGIEPLLASGAKLPPQAFLMTSFAERLAASRPQVTVAAVAALLLLRWALGTWPGRALAALLDLG